MKRPYAKLLSIILIVIFIIALALLFLRQSLVEGLRYEIGIQDLNLDALVIKPAENLVDDSALEHPLIAAMRDYVQVFDVQDICGANLGTKERCSVGNKYPFSLP